MSVITLTTDFGTVDHRVASIKGSILKEDNNVPIVDITHNIDAHNIIQTAYIVKNAYPYFPKGSIHIITIDSYFHKDRKFLLIKANNQYFIMADNGLFSLIFHNIKPEKIYEISFSNKSIESLNFTPIDIFVPVAMHLYKGGIPELIGHEFADANEVIFSKPNYNESKNILSGKIIYIDNFGNSISNINKEIFEKYSSKFNNFRIFSRTINVSPDIKKIATKYTDIIKDWKKENEYLGKFIAIFNEANLLEIALYKGNKNNGASSLLDLNIGDNIYIEFY